MRRATCFVTGLLIGAALGALVALLLAPESGVRTRRMIRDHLNDAAGAARGFAERAEQAAEVLGDRMEHYLGRDEEAAWRRVQELRRGVTAYEEAHAH